VPYVDVPAALDAVLGRAERVPGLAREVAIIPGLAQRDAAAPDVLRGDVPRPPDVTPARSAAR
jgi:2-dehydro-3-deoxygalactonokinase